jgi:demethylmenaquinone methyltransferase/2-methoxy-6-polyprenyl-1,4-benzoquinol methylase
MTTSDRSFRAPEPRRIAAMFDAIAGTYDALNHLLSAGLDRRWRARAIRELELTSRETVMDLCTGTADLAIAAVAGPSGRAARVIGLDFAAKMLRVAARKLAQRPLPITLVQGDATRLPVATNTTDAATIAFGIRNIQDRSAACQEILRVLRPGGRLVILEFGVPRVPVLRAVYLWYFERVLPLIGRMISHHGHAYSYLPASGGAFPSADEFVCELERAGFSEVRAIPLTLGIVYLYMARKGARKQDCPDKDASVPDSRFPAAVV